MIIDLTATERLLILTAIDAYVTARETPLSTEQMRVLTATLRKIEGAADDPIRQLFEVTRDLTEVEAAELTQRLLHATKKDKDKDWT